MSKGRHIHKTDQQCPGLPLPVGDRVPLCGLWAAHFPHAFGETVKFRMLPGS